MKNALAVFVLGSCLTAACQAASCPPPQLDGLLACGKLQDPGERVRCYDGQMASLTPTAAAAATPAAIAPAMLPKAAASMPAPAAEQSPGAQFGEEQLPRTSRAAQAHEDEALLSSITALRTVGQKSYLISLSNGQVWRQDGSELAALFRVGQDARIEKGALGSYHMSIVTLGSKNWVPVTRVR